MRMSVQVNLVSEGIKEMLKSDGIDSEVSRAADRIAAEAGDGFHKTRAYMTGSRVLYRVYGDSSDALIAEADDKVLSRAVSACRS